MNYNDLPVLLPPIILFGWFIGTFMVKWHTRSLYKEYGRMVRERDDFKSLMLNHPPGLPPGGSPTSAMVAAQLQQQFAKPFKQQVEDDREIWNHYAGLVMKNDRKNGLISYDATKPVKVIGPVSGILRDMKPGDTLTVNRPLRISDIEEAVFVTRCRFCGTYEVQGKTHCPNCGGSY